jgi:hypothetical protein
MPPMSTRASSTSALSYLWYYSLTRAFIRCPSPPLTAVRHAGHTVRNVDTTYEHDSLSKLTRGNHDWCAGELVCFASDCCCIGGEAGSTKLFECFHHADQCHAGTGTYVILKSSMVLRTCCSIASYLIPIPHACIIIPSPP